MAPPAGAREKVLIIGGGPAALTAAYELTADGRAGSYDVTILQPGWRLGGKCASGRNAGRGERIEEHGLHVWFGCYDNAFALLRRCYYELDRSGDQHAFTSVDDAFEGFDLSVLYQRRDEAWTHQQLQFPRHRIPPPNFLGFAVEAASWAGHRLLDLQEQITADPTVEVDFSAALEGSGDLLEVFDLADAIGGVRDTLARVASRMQRRVAEAFVDTASHAVDLADLTDGLDAFHALAKEILPRRVRDLPDVLFFLDTTDLLVATLKGVLADDLLGRGFDAINDVDLADWLVSHGATISDDPLEWPAALRGVYDGCFAFVEGDPKQPSMAAGRALQGAVRCLLHYTGSVLYRMRSGMGDTVIAPLYEALERRNREENGSIEVKFCHAAAALRPAGDGQSIAEVEVVRQATLAPGYSPLRDVAFGTDGRTVSTWSSQPPWDLLDDLGGTEPAVAARLEHEIDPFGGTRRTLKAGQDFDKVVLAVPPDVQQLICSALRVDPKYAAMLDHAHTVVTQASQLWLSRDAGDLGQPFASESLMSCFVEPLDTYCDMAHLLPGERWKAGDDVRHVAYFCGVLPHAKITTQAQADQAALRQLEDFLDNHAGHVWAGSNPAARTATTLIDALAGGGPAGGRAERLAAQYWRANWAPTERYGLTLPGTVKYRLGAQDTDFANLVLAGDWTRNGFDAGCVEAAITSGLLAAHALCGRPALDSIVGLNGPRGFPSKPRPA